MYAVNVHDSFVLSDGFVFGSPIFQIVQKLAGGILLLIGHLPISNFPVQ
ncbi:hypothetical protein PDE_08986 [Penicillium oxalicum 114-2]|uniref:Uncharacterized protein n=1 Tax=Penicillium oxalicum (strain 114-2 / CGMCC 5302) TaxID=933388 RepID=S7ZUB5_PENO1|nr:hypothetical protein PDE_08986 [Penicillium oxalicum 114-2]